MWAAARGAGAPGDGELYVMRCIVTRVRTSCRVLVSVSRRPCPLLGGARSRFVCNQSGVNGDVHASHHSRPRAPRARRDAAVTSSMLASLRVLALLLLPVAEACQPWCGKWACPYDFVRRPP